MPSFAIRKYSHFKNNEWTHCPYRTELSVQVHQGCLNIFWRKIVLDTVEVTTHSVLLAVGKYPIVALKLSLISGEILRRIQIVLISEPEFDTIAKALESCLQCPVLIKETKNSLQFLDGCSQLEGEYLQAWTVGGSQPWNTQQQQQEAIFRPQVTELAPIDPKLLQYSTFNANIVPTSNVLFTDIISATEPYHISGALPSPESTQITPPLAEVQTLLNDSTCVETMDDLQLLDLVKAKLQDEKFIEFVKKLESIITSY